MTSDEALAIAHSHVAHQNQKFPFHPDYEYTIGSFEEYVDCWYFDYRIVNRQGLAEREWEVFAGAPGFIISKSYKTVTVITMYRLQQLTQREVLIRQATTALLASALRLQDLRKYLSSSLPELLLLRKSLEAFLSDQQKKDLLISYLLKEPGFE